jgi:carbamoyl-phosphate synthase large subunit
MAENEVGFPLLIRRDFALGGHGSALVKTKKNLKRFLKPILNFPSLLKKVSTGGRKLS